ncbi:Uncharacterized protein MCB1EB_1441 [Mycoavidus cysteinexigens]|uniref:Uncharacterized protein n=1 Tax=Mycoavidus cysteinexigens TaxID=1553431 RepID=A0A2Z6EW15_9BURK|nr:DUF2213 domain-containing protein [Mycoavidus cysteinexigens]BBE09602.1 Uncharacterized protein MCB1EB_1441 [Mycoavidus cysteinexigens]GAM53916.1 phage protein [bacterium endosymbiont of Mortierella elongata FMR23-6]GLR01744.1 hypothetical protein GCM10007934_15560 [Mycoavidus cysteinexigens]
MIEILDSRPSERTYTPEGFLIAPAKLARSGIQSYRAVEFSDGSGDPMRILNIYRPPEEVFAPESLASYEGAPLTNDHPPSFFVTADNWRHLALGFVRNIRQQEGYVVGDLIVQDKSAIALIESGKVGLSAGYQSQKDMTPGITPDGQPYDGIQRNIRVNHIALTRTPRCGPTCRIEDSNSHGEPLMSDTPDQTTTQSTDTTTAVQTAPTPCHDCGEIQNQMDALTETIKKLETENHILRQKEATPAVRDAWIADWAETVTDAKQLMPAITTTDKSCHAIRHEVVKQLYPKHKPVVDALLAGHTLDNADEVMIQRAFKVLSAIPQGTPRRDPVLDALNTQLNTDSRPLDPQTARTQYIQQLQATYTA